MLFKGIPKSLALVGVLFCSPLALHAQSLEEVVAIGDKTACTMADLAVMLPAVSGAAGEDASLAAALERPLARYDADQPLTKARAAWVVARGTRLRTSFFFLLLPLERYAFRAMVMDGIFSATASAGDVMGGIDLLDFVGAVSLEYVGRP